MPLRGLEHLVDHANFWNPPNKWHLPSYRLRIQIFIHFNDNIHKFMQNKPLGPRDLCWWEEEA